MAIDYYNQVAPRYEKQFYPDTTSSHYKVARKGLYAVCASGMGPGKNVLELGCGTGVYTRLFLATGANVLSVDGSSGMLAIAKKKVNANFMLMDINKLSFDPVFDCVVGIYILQYVDIQNVLARVYHVLKPGGVAVFIESNVFNPVTLWYAAKNQVAHPLPRWRYASIMKKIGFSNIKTWPFEFMPTFMDKLDFLPLTVFMEKIPLLKELAGSVFVTGVTV